MSPLFVSHRLNRSNTTSTSHPTHCSTSIQRFPTSCSDPRYHFYSVLLGSKEYYTMAKNAVRVGKKKAEVKKASNKRVGKIAPSLVSPAARRNVDNHQTPKKFGRKNGPNRVLFGKDNDPKITAAAAATEELADVAQIHNGLSPSLTTADKKRNLHVVTPSTSAANIEDAGAHSLEKNVPSAKRRLLFGRYAQLVQCTPNVDSVYKIVRKLTGNIGGNGYSGPIYGELTKHSMQKMIDLMTKHTSFSSSSRFIDVGSGIGKPNLHVAQYPGVEFSCGVEMEHNRWSLGMTCLKACLNAAVQEREESLTNTDENKQHLLQGNTMFMHNNILEAKTFDPFTHVYMFSIGFPPELWDGLSEMWNTSDAGSCQYLICYSGPREIIDCYEFDVELLVQTPTSMHGSKESHMGYIYRRTTSNEESEDKKISLNSNVACDPLFQPSYDLVKSGLKELEREVDRQFEEEMGGSKRATRSQKKIVFSKCY